MMVFATFLDLKLVRQPRGRYEIRRGAELVQAVDAMTASAIMDDPALMCAETDSLVMAEAREAAMEGYRGWCAANNFDA